MRLLVIVLLVSCSDPEPSMPDAEHAPSPVPAARRLEHDLELDIELPERFDSLFLGSDDGARRRALAHEAVDHVWKGRGGRSLAFKIRLADGTEGYFKPEMTFSGGHWYSELGAYYLDRELGFGRVPPAIGRRFVWERLRRVAEEDGRLDEIIVGEDGSVRGAFLWWIPGRLPRWELGRGWERWVRLQPPPYFTPYQRNPDWRALRNGELQPEETELWTLAEADPDAPSTERAAELSDMVVFDFLISNVDRWSTDYTNVRLQGREGSLIFLDNGAGFWPGRNRLSLMDARLEALQRFRRSTIERLEEFDMDRFRRRIATDPLAPVLSEFHLRGIEARRLAVLQHVEALREEYGDEVFLEAP